MENQKVGKELVGFLAEQLQSKYEYLEHVEHMDLEDIITIRAQLYLMKKLIVRFIKFTSDEIVTNELLKKVDWLIDKYDDIYPKV